jgi:hypothetical protein
MDDLRDLTLDSVVVELGRPGSVRQGHYSRLAADLGLVVLESDAMLGLETDIPVVVTLHPLIIRRRPITRHAII